MRDGEITLLHSIDTGHRIVGHEGKCARLHGHTYRMEVLMCGPVKGLGFVVDFGHVKDTLNIWDHKTILWDEDRLWQEFEDQDVPGIMDAYGLVSVAFNPTAENMAQFLCTLVGEMFILSRVELILWETPKAGARAVWTPEDSK